MRRILRRGLLVWGGLFALISCPIERALAQSAIPAISSTQPQAAAPGQSIDIKLRGANLAAPTEFWTSFPVAAVLPAEVAGNGTNAAEVTYRLTVPADVQPAVHGLRVVTSQGISSLKLFAIDDLPSVAQVRPNQTVTAAQSLALPIAVDGFVENLTRDYYKFQAVAGQRLSIEVLARRLGSPLDSMVRLLDGQGRELAYNDDAPGIGSDSMLSHTFKESGEFVIEVRDIRYQGGANFNYRLRIGDFPCITVPYPMGVQRGVSANIGFAGSAAQEALPIPVNIAADTAINWIPLGARLTGGRSSGLAVVAVTSSPETLEVEPNNQPAEATRVTLGTGINGRFDQPGDVDRFVFTAQTGQRFTFAGVTRTQGSPSDLYVRLLKPDGAEAAVSDDTGANEGIIDYTFPADGDYTLVVEDLFRRGGPEFAYRIAVSAHQEKFQLAASTDTLNVPAGGLATVTVTAVRGSFAGPISLTLLDPPEGLQATPSVIGPGLNQTVLTVQAAPSVMAGKIYPVRIAGTAQSGTVQYQAIATVTDAQKAAFSGLPVPPQFLSQTIAAALNPAPLFTLKTDKPGVVFGKDLSATVKVISARTEGFGEDIALAVIPAAPQPGLPPGVAAAVKPIVKGSNEIEITFTANAQAPLGDFSVVLTGTGKQGNATVVQPIPALAVSLQPPFALKPDFAGAIVAKGQELKIKVIAERNPAYAGPINLAIQNLPKGVTASAAVIAAGQNEIEVTLTAAADAAAVAVPNIVIQGEGMNGNAKLTAASPAMPLTVQ
jgi:Bacterial pre-peptidase C-terminal domain